jgi:malate dehydrogenase (oxaloacetate-decarboxylating)(NADP+)
MSKRPTFTDDEALAFHQQGKPGKLEITPTKPMATQRDLSLAYSPGVAAPVRAIAADPDRAYDYTSKGNLVAVISNGTAILGLGNLGALASKPVMEGKAVLFKRFADVDAIDIEVEEEDPDAFIEAVARLGPTFGGINLEDIRAPDSFLIEAALKERMNIPVFHDDQHGTAIITVAGIINACDLTGRDIGALKVVVNGAGAAGIAVLELLKAMGVGHDNAILCDSKGVIFRGRTKGVNQWKSAHAADTDARTLADALKGADVFIGLSVKDAVTPAMVKSMAPKPIIFAMANPDPEITPEAVREVRADAIIATGRSDYPNQVNNVLGFPYIFRGALDVRATTINEEMKIAAANALAELAREDVPDEVAAAYAGTRPRYGPDYIIPVPFDPRLISHIPPAVAQAAMATGVARKPIHDMTRYRRELAARLDPSAALQQLITDKVRANPKRVVFAEGEEEAVIRAAIAFRNQGLGTPVLIGREELIHAAMRRIGLPRTEQLEIHNARLSHYNTEFMEMLYRRLQRRGYLLRDVQRLVNQDRNVFGACMVATGQADAMVTGVTRNYAVAYEDIRRVIDPQPGQRVVGVTIVLARGRTVFVADTTVTEMPGAAELVDIAVETAGFVKRLGFEPRVAFLAYSNFGHPPGERSEKIREAVARLDARRVDFEYEGEMTAHVALDPAALNLYPFARLSGPANVLIMPAIHSARISTALLQELGGCTVIGPALVGLEHPVQIAPLGAGVNDIVNMAAIAAYAATG